MNDGAEFINKQFSEHFKESYSRLENKTKLKLIKIGFKTVLSEIADNENLLYFGLGENGYIYYRNNTDELNYDIEYEKIRQLLGEKFYRYSRKIKESLVGIGYEKLSSIIDSLMIDPDSFNMNLLYDYFNHSKKVGEDLSFYILKKEIEKEKYKKRFKKVFSTMNSLLKNDFLNKGFKNVEKLNEIILTPVLDLIELEFIDKFFDTELEKFEHYFTLSFTRMTKETKDFYTKLGFKNFLLDINNFKHLDFQEYFSGRYKQEGEFYFEFDEYKEEVNELNEYDKFKKEFGGKFSLISEKEQNELIKIGFDKVKELLKIDGILDGKGFHNFFLYLNDKERFEFERNSRIFFNEFGTQFSNCSNEMKKKLFDLGIDFVKENFMKGKEQFHNMLKRIENGYDQEYERKYQEYFNEFGSKFSSLNKEKRDTLINEYSIEQIKEFYNDSYYKGKNLSFVFSGLMNGKEEQKFISEYGQKFTRIEDELKNQLIKLGFEYVSKELSSELIDSYNTFKHFIYFESRKSYEFVEKEKKFFYELGIEFLNLSDEEKNQLYRFGLKKILKDIKSNIGNGRIKGLKRYIKFNGSISQIKDFQRKKDLYKIFGKELSKLQGEIKMLMLQKDIEELKEIKKKGKNLNSKINPFMYFGLKELGRFNLDDSGFIHFLECQHSQELSFQHIFRNYYGNELCLDCFPYRMNNISFKEKELLLFIKKNYKGEINENIRIIENEEGYRKKEIDIYLPELKIGFEFNGIYWHQNDKYSGKYKYEKCKEMGIDLFTIWEDEWSKSKKLLQKKIVDILNDRILRNNHSNSIQINQEIKIKKIENIKEKKDFLNRFHILGNDKSSFSIGGYYKGELVSLLTLTNQGNDGIYTISRYSFKDIKFMNIFDDMVDYCLLINKDIQKIFYKENLDFEDIFIKKSKKMKLDSNKNNQLVFYVKGEDRHKYNSNFQRFIKKEAIKNGIEVEGKKYFELASELLYYKIYSCGSKLYEYSRD